MAKKQQSVLIPAAMLVISFTLLLVINAIQVWSRRRIGYV